MSLAGWSVVSVFAALMAGVVALVSHNRGRGWELSGETFRRWFTLDRVFMLVASAAVLCGLLVALVPWADCGNLMVRHNTQSWCGDFYLWSGFLVALASVTALASLLAAFITKRVRRRRSG